MTTYRSLQEIRKDLSSGEISLTQLVESYLTQIDATSDLNIFLEVFGEESLECAKEVEAKLQAGTAGKLAGAVIAIKDNICYKGHRVGASSKILDGFESLFTSTALQRLIDEDAIVIGRVNCDEFAMGGSNENSAFGNVKNPLAPEYVPGGSSGGSAAAVAADCCLISLGSDTGGSIRQPASFCGIVGAKPTYGRISRHGLIAFASSFDQIGPFAHSAEDVALALEIMSGKDHMDTTSSSVEVTPMSEAKLPKKLKIGFVKECLDSDAIDTEIRESHIALIEQLKSEGHDVEPVSLKELEYLVPTYYVLTTAEASSNLSRYDGIHYGHRSPEATDIESTYRKSRTEGFGPEVKRRIMLGTFVLNAGYYDAYYAKAQKVRRVIKEKTDAFFEKYDLLLSPTTPHTAFKFGAKSDDPIQMYLEDIFTVHANLSGNPAVSVPLFKHSNGLPFGTQIMAPNFKEAEMMQVAHNLMNTVALKG